MKLSTLSFLALLVPMTSFAIVDMRNANYSESFLDIESASSGYDLKVQRTYNSRTVHNGLFGFGWCSDYETKLNVTAENALKVRECGAGLEIEYKRGKSDGKELDAVVKQIMAEVKKRNKGRDDKYFSNLEAEIKKDGALRDEFARQLEIKGSVSKDAKYYGEGRSNDYIVFNGSYYSRRLPAGTIQKFDKEGHLLEIRDTSGNFIKFTRSGNKLIKITDNTGASLQFKYKGNSKYVDEIIGPRGIKANYSYDGEKLAAVKNGWDNIYKYYYDDLYNITRIDYPDKTYVALSYNKEKDWVTSFRDREGCVESYSYKDGAQDPKNNYASLVQKKCGDKITNKSSYEFWHEVSKDGTRYLARSKAEINGEVTDTEYHPEHGRPTRLSKGGLTTKFVYYDNGLLRAKYEPNRDMFYKYDSRCQKPSEVLTKVRITVPVGSNRTPSKAKTKTEVQQVKTQFLYDKRTCNLDAARNSAGLYAKLSYDRQGRISKIVDQSKKAVLITYDARTGKPAVVSRPGIGTIKFKYKSDGQLEKIESDDEPLVAVQVGNMFSNLLEIIAPGTTESPI